MTTSPTRRALLAVVALCASHAMAQSLPSKAATLIVPNPPGGVVDTSARIAERAGIELRYLGPDALAALVQRETTYWARSSSRGTSRPIDARFRFAGRASMSTIDPRLKALGLPLPAPLQLPPSAAERSPASRSPTAARSSSLQLPPGAAERSPLASVLGIGALTAFISTYHPLGVASYTTIDNRTVSVGALGMVFVLRPSAEKSDK